MPRKDASSKKQEGAAEPSLPEVLKERLKGQWQSMAGMALMFIGTISLAIWIQPFYDIEEARAFGEAGASQARFVFMELFFILVFTALVILFIRMRWKRVIKWGVMFIIWFALLYALAPLAYMAIHPSEDEWKYAGANNDSTTILSYGSAPEEVAIFEEGVVSMISNATGATSGIGGVVDWSTELPSDEDSYMSPTITKGESTMILCDGGQWVEISLENGDIVNNLSHGCEIGLKKGDDAWVVIHGNELRRPHPFSDNTYDGLCVFPNGFNTLDYIAGWTLSEQHVLLVTEEYAGLFVIPDNCPAEPVPPNVPPLVEVLWNATPRDGDAFTAADFSSSIWEDDEWWNIESGPKLLVLGTKNGRVTGYEVTEELEVSTEKRMHLENGVFSGPVRGIRLADWNHGGFNDLFIIDGEAVRMFSGHSLKELDILGKIPGEGSVSMAMSWSQNEMWADYEVSDGHLLVVSEDGVGVIDLLLPKVRPIWGQFLLSHIVAFGLSILIMVALMFHPEWYVVNTAGILMGAGVITLIGVSLVPWLIILFMVLAALYDYWAVYRSKHMLELADSMIDLKLPILLVAPQEKGYSFKDEGEDSVSKKDTEGDEREEWKEMKESAPLEGAVESHLAEFSPPPKPKGSGGRDAMFMGLGDVIFPGMLVISALTWLEGGLVAGVSANLLVAIATMIGGLIGYTILMLYVAMGRPQAGLPLLNGGSIVGYFIGALFFVGSSAFALNISW